MNLNIEDIGIVIQGPIKYYREVLDNIDKRFNYIWSIWDDENIESINNISNEIPVVINKKPENVGHNNVNLQCLSTTYGINEINTKYIIKVRGDIIWFKQYEIIMEIFDNMFQRNKNMAFICYKPSIKEFQDFVTISDIQTSKKFWSYIQKDKQPTSPEVQLVKHWLSMNNITYEQFVDNSYFFNTLLKFKEKDLLVLKYNYYMSYCLNEGHVFPKL
jgi:hypothetical protein